MNEIQYNRPLHLAALLTAAATFPLIFMGGLVTSHGAGMSVPDWPNSYGYNMFLFPPNQWVGGILYEHTHRLMGTVVGFCSIVLALLAWGPGRRSRARRAIAWGGAGCASLALLFLMMTLVMADQRVRSQASHAFVGFLSLALVALAAWLARRREPRRWVRWLAVGVLAAVIFQGVLGGLRVVMVELDLAIVHACFAQAFFCMAALAAVVTSRWWIEAPPPAPRYTGRGIVLLSAACVFAIYAQLIAGALMRHHEAGLAIPDLPLHYGALVPPADDASLARANAHRAWHLHLEPVTLGQIWLHFAHRAGAVVVTVAVAAVVVNVWRRHRSRPELVRPAALLLALLLVQVTLGVLTVLLRKPADVASAHVAVGALTLVTAFVLAARAVRSFGLRPTVARRAEQVMNDLAPALVGQAA